MVNQITTRPLLTKSLDTITFKSFYWEKKDLVTFCLENRIPAQGSKIEVTERIVYYLSTGKIQPSKVQSNRIGDWDSATPITMNTLVLNYKNDTVTREFFVGQIGNKFKFNDYLRQFAKISNLDGSLTYGDLVNGWLNHEDQKNSTKQKAPIAKQFQYNQFQRDFYSAEKRKSRREFLDAWKLIKSVPGPATYEHYLTVIKGKNNE